MISLHVPSAEPRDCRAGSAAWLRQSLSSELLSSELITVLRASAARLGRQVDRRGPSIQEPSKHTGHIVDEIFPLVAHTLGRTECSLGTPNCQLAKPSTLQSVDSSQQAVTTNTIHQYDTVHRSWATPSESQLKILIGYPNKVEPINEHAVIRIEPRPRPFRSGLREDSVCRQEIVTPAEAADVCLKDHVQSEARMHQ